MPPVLGRPETIDEIVETEDAPGTLPDAVDELLRRIHRGSTRFDQGVRLHYDHDASLVYAHDTPEWQTVLNAAKQQQWVQEAARDQDEYGEVRLTLRGWQRAVEIDQASPDSKLVFVGMWFPEPDTDEHREMDAVWSKGIRPAVEDAGYDPQKINDQVVSTKLCDEILTYVRRSRFVVVDVTGTRPGVLFEAGYALGLGRDVIWTCKKGVDKELPFNTRQYQHIVWDSPSDLYERLKARIERLHPV